MRIDGKAIAQEIFEDLKQKAASLRTAPHLVVILVGQDPASVAYVRQKELRAHEIGAHTTIVRLPDTVSESELLSTIEQCNRDNSISGIIVQRPLPKHIDSKKIDQAVVVQKDIDAFHTNSPYEMPLAAAVIEILNHVYSSQTSNNMYSTLLKWLQTMNIVVIGKGETGGGPTIELLKKKGLHPIVIDSKTANPQELTKNADFIISTVGKESLIKKENIKQGVILIGVGMFRGEDGKLHGDYEEEDIKDRASFYTPIPGGVGPVNVAMLLKNLIKAAKI